MYQNKIEQKHWNDGIRSMYNSTKGLAQKASDKVLLGAITLDTMLGNPSISYAQETYAQETSENANHSSNGTWAMYTCVGLMFTTLSLSATQKDKRAKIGFGLAGVGFCAAGLIEVLSK